MSFLHNMCFTTPPPDFAPGDFFPQSKIDELLCEGRAEDQSCEFLQVLDGRTDSLVQAPMEDDLGESSQYEGVSFHYYTKEEKNGDIVYVSRYKANAPGVTAHRSMIQIGVDAERC